MRVFSTYDQAALDAQYNNRARVSDYKDYLAKWSNWSEETRAKRGGEIGVSYGPTPQEAVDIFPVGYGKSPVNLFIHGGYWQSFDKVDFSFTAEGMLAHGIASAVVNYDLCPHVSMAAIIDQNRRAVAYLWRNADRFGIDRTRIYVSGHSAGGHLVAMLLATDWSTIDPEMPRDVLRAGCAISGLFDLKPIQLSYLNDVLRMDDGMAYATSPIHQRYTVPAGLTVALGGDESDQYHWQAEIFSQLWKKLGYPLIEYKPSGLNHFSIVDELFRTDSRLVELQVKAISGL
jgi:arylformamidase